MCWMVAIAAVGLAITAASTIVSMDAQQSQAKQQRQYQAAQAAAAQDETRAKIATINDRIGQEVSSAQTEKRDIARQAMRDRATMMTAIGEANISGLSVDALLADAYGNEADAQNRINENLDWTTRQLELEKRGARAQGQSAVNAANRPVQGANWFDAGLRIAGAGVDAYTGYRRMSTGASKTT